MHEPVSTLLGPVSQPAAKFDSSTEIRLRGESTWSKLAAAATRFMSESGEVAVFTAASARSVKGPRSDLSCVRMTERNESVAARIIPIRNPNGKDRPKASFGLLLKGPNTPEMRLFADELHQSKATADEQVMDRGAEGAAGGCDAV